MVLIERGHLIFRLSYHNFRSVLNSAYIWFLVIWKTEDLAELAQVMIDTWNFINVLIGAYPCISNPLMGLTLSLMNTILHGRARTRNRTTPRLGNMPCSSHIACPSVYLWFFLRNCLLRLLLTVLRFWFAIIAEFALLGDVGLSQRRPLQLWKAFALNDFCNSRCLSKLALLINQRSSRLNEEVSRWVAWHIWHSSLLGGCRLGQLLQRTTNWFLLGMAHTTVIIYLCDAWRWRQGTNAFTVWRYDAEHFGRLVPLWRPMLTVLAGGDRIWVAMISQTLCGRVVKSVLELFHKRLDSWKIYSFKWSLTILRNSVNINTSKPVLSLTGAGSLIS